MKKSIKNAGSSPARRYGWRKVDSDDALAAGVSPLPSAKRPRHVHKPGGALCNECGDHRETDDLTSAHFDLSNSRAATKLLKREAASSGPVLDWRRSSWKRVIAYVGNISVEVERAYDPLRRVWKVGEVAGQHHHSESFRSEDIAAVQVRAEQVARRLIGAAAAALAKADMQAAMDSRPINPAAHAELMAARKGRL